MTGRPCRAHTAADKELYEGLRMVTEIREPTAAPPDRSAPVIRTSLSGKKPQAWEIRDAPSATIFTLRMVNLSFPVLKILSVVFPQYPVVPRSNSFMP